MNDALRTESEGGGGASRGKSHGGFKECHLFSEEFVRRKDSFVFDMSTNVRGHLSNV